MRVLVDTSVWVQFLSPKGCPELADLLVEDRVWVHSKILGELSCGQMKNRAQFLRDLKMLPHAIELSDQECIEFIEHEALFGKGLSFIDVHLIASSRVSGCKIFTFDKGLARFSNAFR